MAIRGAGSFATFLIIGPTCFFLGIIFANFPYDYNVIWSSPALHPSGDLALDPREPYYTLLENHLKFLHAAPPLISRILHLVVAVGMLGFMMKLYKPSEANMLFDGASLVLYMCGIVVYVANIIKGLRTVTAEAYGGMPGYDAHTPETAGEGFIGREDSLKVMSASNTILALILVGVLVLQAGQWYAHRKEAEELDQMDKAREEKKALKGNTAGKKKQ